jgi:signal transduction histidine kinase
MSDKPLSTPTNKQILLNWLTEIQDVSWRWVLFAGVMVTIVNVVVVGTVISFYAVYLSAVNEGGMPDSVAIARFAEITGTFLSPLVQLILVWWAASWVVRRVGTAVSQHGLLIGFVSALGGLMQAIVFSGNLEFLGWEVLTFFPLPMLAGWLGARRGRAMYAGNEQLYQISLAVRHANSPQTIINAIGTQLKTPNIAQIGLWEILLQDANEIPTAVSLLASWAAEGVKPWRTGVEFTPADASILAALRPDETLLFRQNGATKEEQVILQALRVRSVLLLPLVAPSGTWVGILAVGSNQVSGLSQNFGRDLVTIGAQIALQLENMRLIQQAKETAVLHERQRMAREIHDTLAQGFTSIVMHLEAAEQALPDDTGTLQRHLDQARQTARDSLGQARRVVDDLRPEVLEGAPLHEAIAKVVKTWSANNEISAQFQVTGEQQPLHPNIEVTLLRSTQEALANIRKHAAADMVSVTLSYLGDTVILDVEDDGVGLMASAPADGLTSSGFGLVAMQERVEQLGGELCIESEPNEGTTIAVSIPLNKPVPNQNNPNI